MLDANKNYTKVAEQAVPEWDNVKAGTIFEQMYTQQKGKIDGVLAANDGLGGAAIAILDKNKVAGKVPVTGQDATTAGSAERPRRHAVHDGLQVREEGGGCALRPGHRPDQG